jgi:hypothetical protein
MRRGISNDVRHCLVQRCRSKRTRRSDFREEAPTEWVPGTLRDPSAPDCMITDEGAWSFVANALEAGVEVAVITLRRPAGKTAYVMELEGHRGVKIYAKLQLGSSNVIGRSFHGAKPER